MTDTGPRARAAGFDVRVPALSTRKADAALRLFAEPPATSVGRRQPAHQRALVGGVRRRRAAPRPRSPASPRRPGRWCSSRRPVGRARPGRPARRRPPRCRAGRHHPAHRRRDPAPRARPRGLAARRRHHASRAAAGPPTCSRRRRASPAEPVAAPEGFEGELRSYQAEALAWLGFLDAGRPRRLPRPRHGPRQDADDARPPARHRRRRPRARRSPRPRSSATGRPRRPGSRPACGSSSTTAPPAPSADELAGEVGERRRRHHHLRHRGARRRGARRRSTWDRRRPRRGAGHQEPGQRDRPAAAPHPRPHAASPSPARRSRTASATCGPSSTSPTRASSARGRRSSPASRRERRRRGARRPRQRAAGAQRHPRVPPHQDRAGDRGRAARPIDELDHCTMTAEQIGLYQAVLDRLVLANDLPEGERAAQGRRSSPPSPRSSRSATTPPPTRTTTGRSPAGRASWPGSRRSSTSVFAAGERMLVFTHFAEWGEQARRPPHRAHRRQPIACYHGGLSPRRPRPAWSTTSRRARARARWCCRSRPAAPGSTSPPPATSCSTTAGGTRRSRTRPATGPGASARPAPSCRHRLVCPGTVDERVEEVVAGKRRIADLVLPKSSSLADLDARPAPRRARPPHPTPCSPRRTPNERERAMVTA